MKNIIVKLALIGLMASSAAAFAQHSPLPSVDQRVQRMTEELGLSAAQQSSVRALLEDGSRQERARETRHAAVEAGLKAILSEDQFEKFQAARNNRKRGRHGAGHAPEDKGRGGKQ